MCQTRELFVSTEETAVPCAEITGIDSRSRRQLALDGERALPVVVLFVQAAQRIGCPMCAGGYVLTEGQITPSPALAIGLRVFQIAVGNVVPSPRIANRKGSVIPAPRRALGLVRNREVDGDAHV